MNYLQFDFDIASAEQSDKLVALLAAHGFTGFEEEEDNLGAFIAENDFNEDEFSGVINMLENVSFTKTTLENINWNSKWEQDFKPVLVDDFVAIRANFHPPVNNLLHEIIITPKMSFGTGHHATTHGVIQQMRDIDFTAKSVLDFGTGTGVLAILASKMGAEKVLATDYDEWSIINAKENFVQNNCTNIRLEQSDTLPATEKFDIILANINLNVILANLALIVNASYPGTIILLSGFLKENENELLAALKQAGLQYKLTRQRGEWLIITATKP